MAKPQGQWNYCKFTESYELESPYKKLINIKVKKYSSRWNWFVVINLDKPKSSFDGKCRTKKDAQIAAEQAFIEWLQPLATWLSKIKRKSGFKEMIEHKSADVPLPFKRKKRWGNDPSVEHFEFLKDKMSEW